MGSSCEDPNKGLDVSVGGLVWVRRRNGSWWPGRILGPDELPEVCLSMPRSGTPVKLLGREDASVDWYNLEKSKRVKAFRCGEYDDCIEKAKSSASLLTKRSVKYARREDAILHALELESARFGKGHPNSQSREQHLVEESPSSSHRAEEEGDIDEDLTISGYYSDSGVSFEEPHHTDANKEESKQRITPNDFEDDGAEGVKRMRGLEDLGVGVSSSSPRRKRSQAAHLHEFLKKKNRRLPLLVSDHLHSPTGYFLPGASESKVSGLESNESEMNNSLGMNNNSDSTGVSCENATSLSTPTLADASLGSKPNDHEISSILEIPENSANRLFDVPLVAEDKPSPGLSTADSDASHKAEVGAGAQSSYSSHVETLSLGNEEHNETGSSSSGTPDFRSVSNRIEAGTCEWQLKGKRNSRSRKTDEAVDPNQVQELPGWSWNARASYDSAGSPVSHRASGSCLTNVEVKTSNHRLHQRVPYISLISKSHGKPITGHPVSIEVLDECYNSSSEMNGNHEHEPRGRRPSKRRASKARSSMTRCPKARGKGLVSTKSKTRRLSSLSQEEKKVAVEKKMKGPSVACVPLNVVFSRINAAWNC